MNANARGKNLRGINVPVASGTASLAVAFTGAAHSGAFAAINTATATTGGTLPAATYFLIASIVTAHGECAPTSEKSVVVGGANNAIAVTFFANTQDGFKRRVYIGTASGVYDGYFDGTLNDNGTFTITNLTYTGIKTPPPAGVDDTAMVEPDANYAVWVCPAWNNANTWVTNKATTGFTIHWGTNPGSDSTLDWLIIR